MKLPVTKAVAATFAYLTLHGVDLLKAMWLPTLLCVGGMALVMPHYLDVVIKVMALGPNPEPAEATPLVGELFKWAGGVFLILTITYPMLYAASLRHIVRGDRLTAPFYLGFGADELRLFGGYALAVIIAVVAYFLFVLGIGVLGGVATLISPAIGGIVIALLGVIGLGALIWFAVRASLTFAASMDTHTIGLAQSWGATKGQAGRLSLFWLIISLVMLAIVCLYMAIGMPAVLAEYSELFKSAGDAAAKTDIEKRIMELQRDYYDASKPQFWPFIISTFLMMLATTALICAAAGTAWRYISGRSGATAKAD